jgi:hypothetical protein
MGIGRQLNHMRRKLVRTSCLVATVCLPAGALFFLSSLVPIPNPGSAFFSQIWGPTDADAGRRRNRKDRDDDWGPPAPKIPIPKVSNSNSSSNSNKNNNSTSSKSEKKAETNERRQNDNDDDDDDNGRNNKKADKSRASAAADVDDTPDVPSTVQGLISRWLAPAKADATIDPTTKVTTGATNPALGKGTQSLSQAIKGSAAQAWSKGTTIAPAAGITNVRGAAQKAIADAKAKAAVAGEASAKSGDGSGKDAARRPLARDLDLRVPLVNQAHILARNLTAQTLKNATDLGLKVKSSRSFDVLGGTITQLVVPPHLDIAQARVALQQIAPDTALSLNQQYRLYPQAKGESSRISQEPARPTGGCTADRCYGAPAIGWQGDLGVCARDLKIGVIDTGIDGSHPALNHDPGRISYGVIGPEKRAPGNDLHGTGVLALLAGDPKSSTPGLVPRAKFFVADIFFADEKGLPVSTTMHLLEALDWMDRMQVQIINLSLSGPSDDLVKTAIAKMSRTRAVDGVTRPGAIFIAAAGNGGPGAAPSYPAAYAEVVAVTAVGKDLRSYRRANQGDYIDIAAPGIDIWTALPDGRQGFQTGTSFATPYVTAVVASIYRSLPRARTKTAVLQRLPFQDLGVPGPDRIYGRGLINAPSSCDPSKTPVATRRVPALPATKVSAN